MGRTLFDPDGILEGLRAAMARSSHAVTGASALPCAAGRSALLITAFEASDDLFYLTPDFPRIDRPGPDGPDRGSPEPTVKKALVKARDVLTTYGLANEHRGLLRLLGADELDDAAILATSAHCRSALDEACTWLRTPFPSDNHVSVHARWALDVTFRLRGAGHGARDLPWVAYLYSSAMIALRTTPPPR